MLEVGFEGLGFEVEGPGFGVWGGGSGVWGFGLKVLGLGLRVSGSGFFASPRQLKPSSIRVGQALGQDLLGDRVSG